MFSGSTRMLIVPTFFQVEHPCAFTWWISMLVTGQYSRRQAAGTWWYANRYGMAFLVSFFTCLCLAMELYLTDDGPFAPVGSASSARRHVHVNQQHHVMPYVWRCSDARWKQHMLANHLFETRSMNTFHNAQEPTQAQHYSIQRIYSLIVRKCTLYLLCILVSSKVYLELDCKRRRKHSLILRKCTPWSVPLYNTI